MSEQTKKPPQETDHTRSVDGGFPFRMGILLVILALVAGGFCYDRFYLIPQATKTIKETIALTRVDTDDGHGLPKDRIQETVGFAPTQTRTVGEYEVETYRFPRLFPFMKGEYMEIVYEAGELVEIFPNQDFASEKMDSGLKVTPSGRDAPIHPAAGGGAPSAGDDEGMNDDDNQGDDKTDADSGGDADQDDAKADDSGDADDQGVDSNKDDDDKVDGDKGDGDKDDGESDGQ